MQSLQIADVFTAWTLRRRRFVGQRKGQAADPVVIAPVLRAESGIGSPFMEMLRGEQIAESNLTDWRKLAQGLHARYVIDDFGTGARFVAAAGRGN